MPRDCRSSSGPNCPIRSKVGILAMGVTSDRDQWIMSGGLTIRCSVGQVSSDVIGVWIEGNRLPSMCDEVKRHR
jgi:hypothetical protein